MNVMHGLVIGAGLAMERQEQEPPRVERGEECRERAKYETVKADAGAGGPGGLQDCVL